MYSKQTNDIILEGLIEQISIRGREWFLVRHEPLMDKKSVFPPGRKAPEPDDGPSRERRLDEAMMNVVGAVAALNEFLEGMGESAESLLASVPEDCEYGDDSQEMF